jgi:uncharacterized protein (DUF2141 family)
MQKSSVALSHILLTVYMLFSNGFTVKNKLVSTVTLKIDGVDVAVGEIRIAIFDSENRYMENPSLAEIVPVSQTNIEWQIENLAYGQYAIAVYHDKNKNGKLDTNMLGIPLEEYGFSNNARGRFGPASWSQAKFTVNKRTTVHRILLE